jgi:ELWxxDGT repeat protein
VGNTLLFAAYKPTEGVELWKSDGTAEGTVLVKDIVPGPDSGNPFELTAAGNTLFFRAFEPSTGEELWKSDGTAEGTVLVKDIAPGMSASNPASLIAMGSNVLFGATVAGTNGLWKSDGTPQGTFLVASNVFPSLPAVADGLLFFVDASRRLWRSDGTSQGTYPVSNFPLRVELLPAPTAVGDTLFFKGCDETAGCELWKSDGTVQGTIRLKDIFPGSYSSMVDHLVAVGNTLFFEACEPVTGCEPWKSDGTEAGTVLVEDISVGPTGGGYLRSSTTNWADVGGVLLFSTTDGVLGQELWRSKGTPRDTFMLQDIAPGPASSFPDSFTVAGKNVFFVADDGITGRELWLIPGFASHTGAYKAPKDLKRHGRHVERDGSRTHGFRHRKALESVIHAIAP